MANTEIGAAYLTIIPSMKGFGQKVSSGVTSELKSIAGGMTKAFAASTAAAAAAVGVIGKQALDAYADYEQLVGGMDTLFKESSGTMQKYAAEAYKTAQMSANEYMELSTSFAASLISSLGGDTAAAAEYANKAMGDMADNANKMGTSMEDIENAYKGFSKQNYTMLDNLKLGYGGTKSEMERLISDANKVKAANGEMADLSIDSFADVVEAIHTIQEEMGITGTTALEASTTIQGSVAMSQAAWQNWLTGLGSDTADMTELTTQLVESVATAAGNIIPRLAVILGTLLASLPNAFAQLSAVIGEKIPEMLTTIQDTFATLLPTGVQGVIDQLLPLISGALTSISEFLLANAPAMVSAIMQFVPQLMVSLAELVNTISAQLPTFVATFAQVLIENMPTLLDGAGTLFTAILSALVQVAPQVLASLLELLVQLVQYVFDHGPELLTAALDLIGQFLIALAQQLPSILGSLVSLLGQLVAAVFSAAPTFLATIVQYFGKFLIGLAQNLPSILSNVGSLLGQIVSKIAGGAGNLLTTAGNYFGKILSGAKNAIPSMLSYVANIPSRIVSSIGSLGSTLYNAGSSLINGLYRGIKSAIQGVYNFVSGIASKIASLKGPISYDRKVLIPNGEALMESLETGLRDSVGGVYKMVSGIAGNIADELVSETQLALDASSVLDVPSVDTTQQLEQAISATDERETYSGALGEITALLDGILNKESDVYMDSTKVSQALALNSRLALAGAGVR